MELTVFETVSIGRLIDALKGREQDQEVRFDFGGFCPAEVDSYRGYYDHLAIGFNADSHQRSSTENMTVAQLIAMLRSADGKTFTGYKGGDFTMDEFTPVWVANYGCATGTAIVGIAECNYMTVISTAFVD